MPHYLRPIAPCLLLALASCVEPPHASAPPPPAPTARPRVSSGTALERYLPLIDGQLYQYEFETGDGQRGLLSARIQRADARRGAWLLPGGGNVFVYAEDGVMSEGSAAATYLLKAPLTVGNRWPGAQGSVVDIRRLDVTVTVPAGTFSGCVETHEARGGDIPRSVVATFCPDVGMVSRAVTSGPKRETLTLKSFGDPVDLGPDGVRVVRED